MSVSNYDKFPATTLSGYIRLGWDNILPEFERLIRSHGPVLAVETYVGIHLSEIVEALRQLAPDLLLQTPDLFKTTSDVETMTQRFVTDDPIFGYRSSLTLSDYLDEKKVAEIEQLLRDTPDRTAVIIGPGASLVAPPFAPIIYADLARWEHQQRMKNNAVSALGIDIRDTGFSNQHKRAYFNDWPVCDAHKKTLFDRVSYWLDTHVPTQPKLIDKATFFEGIERTVNKPFRVVPYFAPAPWGGQWMKEMFHLDKDERNYGWCFDCVPEENSLLFDIDGERFELPSINLVFLRSRELLGEPVESRFGQEFPIRFDFLDTMGGGYLSFQVHPTTTFIKDHFGMSYTQDESYYMMEAKKNATVYLGLKNRVNRDAMASDLRRAACGELVFDTEKYANKWPAKKHDHFLIPAGTVHCSGPEGVVLEISATPNHFTFKMWDWGRVGLDGKPRPINVERGLQVIDWNRDTTYTKNQLFNVISTIDEGDGWKEERTGLHPNEFIETRRHTFSTKVTHRGNGSVHVLNLVEGEEVVVESDTQAFEPFVVHYAETFIVPAQIDQYSIRPWGKSIGKTCMTLKAYIRF
ncbi:class I mannose-6-phosphate isomerase [Sphingobacterium suaedae]|uniref:Class I mannose-6-phosphate isomerase n=1 Tax=Sphingobacterium suaedae TaxID=1686402 RepID=A0ABW5KBQ4_9SPHI